MLYSPLPYQVAEYQCRFQGLGHLELKIVSPINSTFPFSKDFLTYSPPGWGPNRYTEAVIG
jgi:hypothetical protein